MGREPDGAVGGGGMTDRPILFSGTLVRAILDGRKTETRRLVTAGTSLCGFPELLDVDYGNGVATTPINVNSKARLLVPLDKDGIGSVDVDPRIKVGDRLWVRETWRPTVEHDGSKPSLIPSGSTVMYEADRSWRQDVPGKAEAFGGLQPSIFMPRWAARIFLRVTEVRAERLQDIDEEGAKREGVDMTMDAFAEGMASGHYRSRFAMIWDRIYGKKPAASWAANPWVWVVKFEREA